MTPAASQVAATSVQTPQCDADASRGTLVLTNLEVVHEVTLDSLLDAVLPACPLDLVALVCTELQERKIVDDRAPWKGTGTLLTPRGESPGPEEDGPEDGATFSFLEDIFAHIADALSRHERGSAVRISVSGAPTPLDCRVQELKLDGSLSVMIQPSGSRELDSKDPGAHWLAAVLAIRFRNRHDIEEHKRHDYAKVLRFMHRVMHNDFRRRFVFGLTIEKTETRFWFLDKATASASEPFDLNADWRVLVRILVSIAQASHAELGFDETVRIVGGTQTRPVYDIDVYDEGRTGCRTFRTTGVIAEHSALALCGRCTRVFRVRELLGPEQEPSSTTFVLKDSWPNRDRVAEHRTLRAIREKHPNDPRLKHLLTVVAAGDVPVGVTREADDTTRVIRRGRQLVATGRIDLKAPRERWAEPPLWSGNPHGLHTLPHARPDPPDINAFPRRHYRIVFGEEGEPLSALRDYKHAFDCLLGAFAGIRLMHDAGYLHRDVSAYNMLYVPRPSGERVGVLIDLEYAVSVRDAVPAHDVRTGTPDFVSTEVALGAYLGLRHDPARVFRPNAFHDCQSVWWVAAWLLFRFTPFDSPELADARAALFPPAGGAALRSMAWANRWDAERYVLPLGGEAAGLLLEGMQVLWDGMRGGAYADEENFRDPGRMARAARPAEEAFGEVLRRLRDALPEGEVEVLD